MDVGYWFILKSMAYLIAEDIVHPVQYTAMLQKL